MSEFIVSIDRSLFLLFNKTLSNPLFDAFFPYITERQNWYIPILAAITVFLVKARDRKKAGIVIGLAILTIAITNPLCISILKPLFHRLRPCHPSYFQDNKHLFLAGSHFLLGTKISPSFPSAHAMNSFAQAMHLALWYPKRRVWFFTMASLVAFSRIYVGVHYPFDVLLGSMLGAVFGAGIFYGYQRLCNSTAKRFSARENTAS